MKTMEGSTALPTIQRTTGRDLLHWPWVSLDWHSLSPFRTVPHLFLLRLLPAEFHFFSTDCALALRPARKVSCPEGPKLALLP